MSEMDPNLEQSLKRQHFKELNTTSNEKEICPSPDVYK